MPPSSDDQPERKPPQPTQRRGGPKRRPGNQPGTAGAYLPWNDHPDGTIVHFPEGTCGCGRNLAGTRDLGVRYSRQVTDLPEARAQTIQHDRHEVQCACGRTHIAAPPPEAAGAPGTVTYGLNFQAWCVFLMVMHHLPVERCADILGSMSGTRPPDGWVHALLARAATANTTIRALIITVAGHAPHGPPAPTRHAGPGRPRRSRTAPAPSSRSPPAPIPQRRVRLRPAARKARNETRPLP
jgi:transposase